MTVLSLRAKAYSRYGKDWVDIFVDIGETKPLYAFWVQTTAEKAKDHEIMAERINDKIRKQYPYEQFPTLAVRPEDVRKALEAS